MLYTKIELILWYFLITSLFYPEGIWEILNSQCILYYTMGMTLEECPNCKGRILVYDKAVEKKIGDKKLKFCSQTCADAYKEITETTEEIREGKSLVERINKK